MAKGSRGGGRPSGGSVRGYTLRGNNGKVNYVGTTNSTGRRAAEHKSEGKSGRLQAENSPYVAWRRRAMGSESTEHVSGQSWGEEPTPQQDQERIGNAWATGRDHPSPNLLSAAPTMPSMKAALASV